MSVDYGFPQPTNDELNAPVFRYIGCNPYWWRIVQGLLEPLTREYLWDNYTEALDQAIEALSRAAVLPECPDPPTIWCHTFDFAASNHGFTVVSGGGGSYQANIGWNATTVGANGNVHIEKTMASRTILGMSAFVNIQNVNTPRTVELATVNGGTHYFYQNSAHASAQNVAVAGSGYQEAQTKIRGRLNAPNAFGQSIIFKRITVWGEGVNPF